METNDQAQENSEASADLVPRSAAMSALQCSLCLSLLCEPISIACGHTFCRVCLVESLRRHKKSCPSCRAVCHVAAETAAENIIIKNLAILFDSDTYQTRLEEVRLEKENWTALYPIFYYNSVMFPGSSLSLHLFEPRYRQMIARIVNTTQAFAYVPNFSSYNARHGEVALVAKLQDVNMLPDGRCFLEATLLSRHQIVDHFVEEGTQGLHYCRLIPYKDNPIAAEDQEIVQHLFTQGRQLAEYVSEEPGVRRKIEERYGLAPSDIEGFSLWLTAITPMSETDKLSLLICKDTKDRLQRAQLALGAYVSQQSASNSRQQAASSGSGGLTGAVVTAVRTMMSMIRTQRSGSQDQADEAHLTAAEQAEEDEEEVEEEENEAENEEADEDTVMSEDDHTTTADATLPAQPTAGEEAVVVESVEESA
jgi:Lon protease-like protein